MALAVCHLPLYGCTAALPSSSMSSHFNRTVRPAVAVALFLSCGEKEYAFLKKEPAALPPERSWVIWTVVGVLLGAVMTVMRLLNRKKYPPQGALAKRPGGL